METELRSRDWNCLFQQMYRKSFATKNTEIFGGKGCLQTTNAPVQQESSLVFYSFDDDQTNLWAYCLTFVLSDQYFTVSTAAKRHLQGEIK